MANDKELSSLRLQRIEIISQLYRRGKSVHYIRTEVMKRLDLKEYSTRTCSNDISEMLKEWKEARLKRVDEIIELELSRTDELIDEAWEAWERSKKNSVRTTQRQRAMPIVEEGGGIPSTTTDGVSVVSMEQEQMEESQTGDPRFLELINKLSSERRKMLGLYAPEKLELSGTNGEPIKQEHTFAGFSFLPYTEGLQNSNQSRIASGEIQEQKEKEPVYAEVIDYVPADN